MFRRAKVGDRVWSYLDGWGTIIDTSFGQEGYSFPIRVQYSDSDTECYTTCGKLYNRNINPTLFWDEIKFDIPDKPLPELEVDTKVLVWNNGESKYRGHFYSFTEDGRIRAWSNSTSSFTANSDDCYTLWPNWELYEENK